MFWEKTENPSVKFFTLPNPSMDYMYLCFKHAPIKSAENKTITIAKKIGDEKRF